MSLTDIYSALINQGFKKVDPDQWIFANEGFLKGQKHLLKNITRRKPANNNAHTQPQPQVQSSSPGPCIDKGKTLLSDEVENLKKDKNSLMQELVCLRQQQQTTDHQLQNVVDRIHVMEQRQQQLMSFLAKAVQSPGFFNQIVQEQTESNRRVAGGNKKRRLPMQEEESLTGQHDPNNSDGQMVRFQPSINEGAKAAMHQILTVSPKLESWMDNNPANFFIGHLPSPSRISGVTLSEVSQSPESSPPVEPVPPVSCPPSAFSVIQPSNQIPGINGGDVSPNFSQMLGNFPGSPVESPNVTSPEVGDILNQVLDGTIPIDDFTLDELSKLPTINDVFWDQFLTASPLTSDTCEIDSGSPVSGQELPTGLNGWDNVQQMSNLTEQMGLLVSENGIL
ncbi:hypothetical protein ACFE04_006907 [Oxalis oulophora]